MKIKSKRSDYIPKGFYVLLISILFLFFVVLIPVLYSGYYSDDVLNSLSYEFARAQRGPIFGVELFTSR